MVEILEEANLPDKAVLVLECSPAQKEAWRAEAIRRDRTLSSFVRTVLDEELARAGQR